jgi:ATP-dependent protease ClpP protease subunit
MSNPGKKRREVPSSALSEKSERAVFLSSEITDDTYGELVQRITQLRLKSNEPICLYINSLGGNPTVAEEILRLIRAPKQDGQKCALTTVCMGLAASAAADLLSAGDYAIAYANSIIIVHGTRGQYDDITLDDLPEVESSIRQRNEHFAMMLASKMFRRFATQALLLEAFKTQPPQAIVIGVSATPESVLDVIRKKVDARHKGLIDAAIDRVARMRTLYNYLRKTQTLANQSEAINDDKNFLKSIIDFEANDLLKRKKAGEKITGFTRSEIDLIYEDFINIKELLSGSYHEKTKELCHEKGHYFLTGDEYRALLKIKSKHIERRGKYLEKKAFSKIFQLWYLVVSLCRLLQKGENTFTAKDAWYFGLVDEVVGSDLPSIRKWRELKTVPSISSTGPQQPSAQSPPVVEHSTQ